MILPAAGVARGLAWGYHWRPVFPGAQVPISRRSFFGAGAAAAAGSILSRSTLAIPPLVIADLSHPGARAAPGTRPVIISSANGIRGVARAYEMITQHGADPLDAVIAGVNIQELDPEDQSVGLGGLPNEDGVVQLDASVMHGPTKRAGAVGALEDIATPSLVAKAVMDYTDHIFLVGAGAKKFAVEMGFKEQNLLTEKSRQAWLRWKANLNPNDAWLDHPGDVKIVEPVPYTHGTINMNAVDAHGDIGSVTTTSGLSWKIPGRVGECDHRRRAILRQRGRGGWFDGPRGGQHQGVRRVFRHRAPTAGQGSRGGAHGRHGARRCDDGGATAG
jgi:N4-(beta-N-acetylglucosaminyl)-L-asparaginase